MATKKARFMEAVAEKVSGKRKPMLKRKGGPTVVIAIGAPKMAPPGKAREDEEAPEDRAEDKAEYGSESGTDGGMCECPECGHQFKAGEHMAEADAEAEDDSEMESED